MIKVGMIETEEFEKIIASEKPTIVDFSAIWCGPCKMMEPVLEDASEKFAGDFNFYQIDIDSASNLAEKYLISAVPTIIAFKNGTEISRTMGYQDFDSFELFLKSVK